MDDSPSRTNIKSANRRLVVAITGASGAAYAIRLLDVVENHCKEIYVALSDQARQVIALETGLKVTTACPTSELLIGRSSTVIKFVDRKDYFTPPASGSFLHDGMVIVPCSMGTVGRIANGISDDLVTRAADVCLKERRKLIVVPRETPWNLIHLRNLTRLAEAGAVILPASPGFYNRPETMSDLIDHVVGRILQQLDIPHNLTPQWRHSETD